MRGDACVEASGKLLAELIVKTPLHIRVLLKPGSRQRAYII